MALCTLFRYMVIQTAFTALAACIWFGVILGGGNWETRLVYPEVNEIVRTSRNLIIETANATVTSDDVFLYNLPDNELVVVWTGKYNAYGALHGNISHYRIKHLVTSTNGPSG
tara:strand:+ start:580 stop:918 length:339 start_codon:yes stop_codon:yes gene_type:complete